MPNDEKSASDKIRIMPIGDGRAWAFDEIPIVVQKLIGDVEDAAEVKRAQEFVLGRALEITSMVYGE